MKNILLSFVMILSVIMLNAQSVQRNVVIVEIGTGTWCQYCPGAAVGAEELIANGAHVAVIENHNGDVYANTFSNARNSYYGISGYPTAKFDGVVTEEGGAACPNGNMYSSYEGDYNQRYSIPSPVSICFSGTHVGNDYTITVNVTKLANLSGSDPRLHLVLTESNIAVNWQGCMTEVDYVNRLMVPGSNGTTVSFSSGNTQVYTLTFTVDPGWNLANCELVAFLQDNATKEVYNGIKSPMNSLPASVFTLNDFTSNVTSGCSPLTVNFTTTQPSNVTYTWTFEGGNPTTSTISAPTVNYTNTGVYDVVLFGTDGVCSSSRVKSDYITVNGSPANPSTPNGETSLCENPSNQTYSILPIPAADSYVWELLPAESGVLTPNGNSCSINWSDTWLGVATLKVKAGNSCGESNWSPALSIAINAYPGQCPPPAGQVQLCANASNTPYTTAGIPNATYYFWELTPASAGTVDQGSSSTEVNWADDFSGSASLRVVANNGACGGTYSEPLAISINTAPAVYTVSGGGTYCGPSGIGMPVDLSGSETGTTYSLMLNGTSTGITMNGTGSAISFGNQLSAGNYTVSASSQNSCSAAMTGIAPISVDPQAPVKPSDPLGPAVVITTANPTSSYTTNGSQYATTYSWSISPADAGTINGDLATSTVTWNQSYIGSSVIKVQGVNTCGNSEYSNEITTTVNIGVGIPNNALAGGFALTPNPAHNTVTLTSQTPAEWNLYILNYLGDVVVQKATTGPVKEVVIDISNLPAGVYTAVISTQQGKTSQKLLVQ